MKAAKYNKSRIMRRAHREYKATKDFGGIYTFARALRVAWSAEKLFIEDLRREEEERRVEAQERAELIAKGGNPDNYTITGISEGLLESAIDYGQIYKGASLFGQIQAVKSVNI